MCVFWPESLLLHLAASLYLSCADPESFARGGPTLTGFFVFLFFNEGNEDPNNTKCGPSLARQRNAIKWRFAGGPMMAQH